jgi:hypothetical protein
MITLARTLSVSAITGQSCFVQVEKFQIELLEMLLAPNPDIEAVKQKVRDFKFTVSPEQVALAMVLMKVAREQFQHKQGNLQDVIGWLISAKCARYPCRSLRTECHAHIQSAAHLSRPPDGLIRQAVIAHQTD